MLLTTISTAPRNGDAPTREERSPGRVLVVDDVESQRDAVTRALRAEGFEVAEATCGPAALEAARVMEPDAVVLDEGRPDVAGFDICRRLKAAAPTLLPVLHLLSAGTSRESRARWLDAGFDGYLTHPLNPNELRTAVSTLVRLKRHEAERVAGAAVNAIFHDALDALADHVALLGRDGKVIGINRAWVDFAAANGHIAGGAGLELNYGEICERASGVDAEVARAIAEGIRQVLADETQSFELDYPCRSPAAAHWFRLVIRRVAGTGPVAAIATHIDRTRERLNAQVVAAALAAAEANRQRLEATLEAIPVGVWLSDAAGRLTHSNPAAARLWGGDAPLAEQRDRHAMYRAWWPDPTVSNASDERPLARTLRTGETIRGELVEIGRVDGMRGHMLTSSAPMLDDAGRITGGIVIGVDITAHQAAARERERLVASLETERAHLAAIFQQAPAFLAVLRGPHYVFERVNPAYLQLVGPRDPVGKPLLEALPEIRNQGFIALLDHVRTTGEPFTGRQMPVRLARVPGAPLETRFVDMVYQRLVDADGEFAIIAHGVDVTEQVLATEALRYTEQRLRDQFAKQPVPTYLWESRGDDFVLLDWNEAALRAIPRHDEAGIGMTARELFPGMEAICEDLRRCISENVVVQRSVEFDAGAPLGRRCFDLTVGPQQPDRVLVHAVDTTDRTELEEQLRQAQKMEAVGRLAGGVAHDFNNLLTVIGAHCTFLLESLDPADSRYEDADAIQKAGARAAALTRQLLAFSRKQVLEPAPLALNAIVEETRQMLERLLLGEGIEIVTHLASDLGCVIADATQIDQVLMNLAVNARDAMPGGGRLTITTRNVAVVADMPAARRVIPPGDYVLLEVCDTGMGMDAATQARLFEPFFTTKGPGKGTGLGLATVYGIVKQSSGFILVTSALAHGTTFQMYLPLALAEAAADERRVSESPAVGGAETVPVIEDAAAVREIARRAY